VVVFNRRLPVYLEIGGEGVVIQLVYNAVDGTGGGIRLWIILFEGQTLVQLVARFLSGVFH